tara:strand:+ start:349 stop:663 length:315 start_codon:yes stop_codon:yes gene_type:complete
VEEIGAMVIHLREAKEKEIMIMSKWVRINWILCIFVVTGGLVLGHYQVFLSCGLASIFIVFANQLGGMKGMRINKKSPAAGFRLMGFFVHALTLIWLLVMGYYR